MSIKRNVPECWPLQHVAVFVLEIFVEICPEIFPEIGMSVHAGVGWWKGQVIVQVFPDIRQCRNVCQ